jgi:hypothetical protein
MDSFADRFHVDDMLGKAIGEANVEAQTAEYLRAELATARAELRNKEHACINYATLVETLEARAEKAEAELTKMRKALDLVALLNGDGGHRIGEVGLEQAVVEAKLRYDKLATSESDLAAERKRVEDLEKGLSKAKEFIRIGEAFGFVEHPVFDGDYDESWDVRVDELDRLLHPEPEQPAGSHLCKNTGTEKPWAQVLCSNCFQCPQCRESMTVSEAAKHRCIYTKPEQPAQAEAGELTEKQLRWAEDCPVEYRPKKESEGEDE